MCLRALFKCLTIFRGGYGCSYGTSCGSFVFSIENYVIYARRRYANSFLDTEIQCRKSCSCQTNFSFAIDTLWSSNNIFLHIFQTTIKFPLVLRNVVLVRFATSSAADSWSHLCRPRTMKICSTYSRSLKMWRIRSIWTICIFHSFFWRNKRFKLYLDDFTESFGRKADPRPFES